MNSKKAPVLGAFRALRSGVFALLFRFFVEGFEAFFNRVEALVSCRCGTFRGRFYAFRGRFFGPFNGLFRANGASHHRFDKEKKNDQQQNQAPPGEHNHRDDVHFVEQNPQKADENTGRNQAGKPLPKVSFPGSFHHQTVPCATQMVLALRTRYARHSTTHYEKATAATPNPMQIAPAKRTQKPSSFSNEPAKRAANSIETSRAGATFDRSESFAACKTRT
jgi:hypothetical protein